MTGQTNWGNHKGRKRKRQEVQSKSMIHEERTFEIKQEVTKLKSQTMIIRGFID